MDRTSAPRSPRSPASLRNSSTQPGTCPRWSEPFQCMRTEPPRSVPVRSRAGWSVHFQQDRTFSSCRNFLSVPAGKIPIEKPYLGGKMARPKLPPETRGGDFFWQTIFFPCRSSLSVPAGKIPVEKPCWEKCRHPRNAGPAALRRFFLVVFFNRSR